MGIYLFALLIATAVSIGAGLVCILLNKLFAAQLIAALGVALEFVTLILLVITVINNYGGIE